MSSTRATVGRTKTYPIPEKLEGTAPSPYDTEGNSDHYGHGDEIECIDAMRAQSTTEEFRGHLRLTAIKYLWRLGKKDEPTQEITKVEWYLNKLKETYEVKT